MIDEMREKYRKVRQLVFEKATKPSPYDEKKHLENKNKFKESVIHLANSANLDCYSSSSEEAKRKLWNQLWTKNRYAGIRAEIASNEIRQISDLFDDYRWFQDAGWDIDSNGHALRSAGNLASSFLNRAGAFHGKQTIGNVAKLKKIVTVARAFNRYFEEHKGANAIDFVTCGVSRDNVWDVHDRLLALGYGGDLTALHFMMDVGFPVIKPDLVISRLFLDWGWLHKAEDSLPHNLTRGDLLGRGEAKPKSRYLYTNKIIYKPIIDLAVRVVSDIDPQDLVADIGWSTDNPIREFDIFLVKSGQRPEPEIGIECQIYD